MVRVDYILSWYFVKDVCVFFIRKVNEDKTGLVLMGSASSRRRLLEGGGSRTVNLAGEVIKPAPKAKSLGQIISEDMNWTDEVDTRLAKCSHKLRSMMRLRGVVTMEQRKVLAEGMTAG